MAQQTRAPKGSQEWFRLAIFLLSIKQTEQGRCNGAGNRSCRFRKGLRVPCKLQRKTSFSLNPVFTQTDDFSVSHLEATLLLSANLAMLEDIQLSQLEEFATSIWWAEVKEDGVQHPTAKRNS